jgi:hypothetical protein
MSALGQLLTQEQRRDVPETDSGGSRVAKQEGANGVWTAARH